MQAAVPQSSTGVPAKKRGRPPKTTMDSQQPPLDDASQQQPGDESSTPQPPLTQDIPHETAQKKRRGRPPKTSHTQVQTRKKPAGIGVLIGDDGHTYLSGSRSTVRLTNSQPTSQVPEDN